MALIANCHRDSKKQTREFTAWDFFRRPGAKRPSRTSLTVDSLHGLRAAFTQRTR